MTPGEIARGLSKAQREALAGLSDLWRPGPDLPPEVTDCVINLRLLGLVERTFDERTFDDNGLPTWAQSRDEIRVAFRACWFFRLAPLGLAVRALLEQESHDEG